MWILAGKIQAYVNGQSQDTQLIAGHDLQTEHCLPVPLTSLRWLETLFLLLGWQNRDSAEQATKT
jgi:hypothetical protein